MTYYVAVRPKRTSEYVAHSEHDHYGLARLEQLTQKGRHYDAQVYSSPALGRGDLVYAPPKAGHLINPYNRLIDLFMHLQEEGAFRCLVARPGSTSGRSDVRMYLYSFARRLNYIRSVVHTVDLRRDSDVITTYVINYTPAAYEFRQMPPVVQPVRAGRMDGVWIADVAAEFGLYFGYIEALSEDPALIVEQVRIDTRNLYDL